MKSLATLGLALGLSASSFAGETSAPASTAPASTSSSLLTWFAGGSVGYLIDNEEAFYTLHAGLTFAESGPISHSVFLEGAYTEVSELVFETEIIPVTLNYKLDYAFNDAFSAYFGAGVGAAFLDTEVAGFSDSSTELAAQIFAGVGYDVTENFQLFSGVRWIWVDDSSFFGLPVETGDDVGVELGARFKF